MKGVFLATAVRWSHPNMPPGYLSRISLLSTPESTASAILFASCCTKCITTCSISAPNLSASSSVKYIPLTSADGAATPLSAMSALASERYAPGSLSVAPASDKMLATCASIREWTLVMSGATKSSESTLSTLLYHCIKIRVNAFCTRDHVTLDLTAGMKWLPGNITPRAFATSFTKSTWASPPNRRKIKFPALPITVPRDSPRGKLMSSSSFSSNSAKSVKNEVGFQSSLTVSPSLSSTRTYASRSGTPARVYSCRASTRRQLFDWPRLRMRITLNIFRRTGGTCPNWLCLMSCIMSGLQWA